MAPKTEQPMWGHGGQVFSSEAEFVAYLQVFLGFHTGLGAAAFQGKSCQDLLEEAEEQGLVDIDEWPSLSQLERAKGKGKGKGKTGKGPY